MSSEVRAMATATTTATATKTKRAYSAPDLAAHYPVPLDRLRRELDVLEALGRVVTRVGRYRLVWDADLPELEVWLRERGVLPAIGEAVATVG